MNYQFSEAETLHARRVVLALMREKRFILWVEDKSLTQLIHTMRTKALPIRLILQYLLLNTICKMTSPKRIKM